MLDGLGMIKKTHGAGDLRRRFMGIKGVKVVDAGEKSDNL